MSTAAIMHYLKLTTRSVGFGPTKCRPRCKSGRTLACVHFRFVKCSLGFLLLNHFDRGLPKGTPFPCRVQRRYLAVIFAWRKMLERNGEGEGHCLQATMQAGRHFHRRGFKGFGLIS